MCTRTRAPLPKHAEQQVENKTLYDIIQCNQLMASTNTSSHLDHELKLCDLYDFIK